MKKNSKILSFMVMTALFLTGSNIARATSKKVEQNEKLNEKKQKVKDKKDDVKNSNDKNENSEEIKNKNNQEKTTNGEEKKIEEKNGDEKIQTETTKKKDKKITKNKKSGKFKNKKNLNKQHKEKETTTEADSAKFADYQYFKIPIKIESESPFVRATILNALCDELSKQKVIKNENFKVEPLISNDELYPLLLDKNFEEGIILKCNGNEEKLSLKNFDKEIKIKQLKKFINNFKVNEKNFEASKNKILKILNKAESSIKKNIKNYRNYYKEDSVVFFPSFDEKQKKDTGALAKQYYEEKVKPMIKIIDDKLYAKIEEKLKNINNKEDFFKAVFDNFRNSEIEKFNDSLKKINSSNGFISKFKNLKYNSEIGETKIKKVEKPIEKYKLTESLAGVEGIVGMHEIAFNDFAYYVFENLKLNSEEKTDFKKYYKTKLDEHKNKYKNDNMKAYKEKMKQYVNDLKNKKLISKTEKDSFEKTLKEKQKSLDFWDEIKDNEKFYYENFIDRLEQKKN